jgi:hypothetical protein
MRKFIKKAFLRTTRARWRRRLELLLCALGFHCPPDYFEESIEGVCTSCAESIPNPNFKDINK